MSSLERFMAKVDKTEACWLWTAALTPTGYGQVWHDGKVQYAHRVAYGLLVAPIQAGLEVDHLCRNRACVNPAHLELVTRAENIARMAAANRRTHCPRGHALDEHNVVMDCGTRRCRTCVNDRARRRRANRRKAKLSTTAVRKQLAPAVLDEKYTTHGAKQVSIR